LTSLFTSSGSIVGPLDTYLNNQICSQSACSNETLTDANNTITENCAEDIASGSTLIVGLQTIIEQYSTIREIGCLQAAGNGTRCITQTLYAVQNATGSTIDLNFVTGLLGGGNTSLTDLASLDRSVVCTGCTQAIYDVATEGNNGTTAQSALARGIDQKCGSSFTTSGFPADVSNPVNPSAANSASASGSSAAATSTAAGNAAAQSWNVNAMTVLAAGALGLGVVGGAFGVLA